MRYILSVIFAVIGAVMMWSSFESIMTWNAHLADKATDPYLTVPYVIWGFQFILGLVMLTVAHLLVRRNSSGRRGNDRKP